MTTYDTHAPGYAVQRRTDPRIAELVHTALGDARTVLNVGAGAWSTSSTRSRRRQCTRRR